MAAILRQTAPFILTADTTLGRYRVEQELGAGGMGAVYRAFDTQLRRPVALKVLPEQYLNEPQAVARFKREMQSIGALEAINAGRSKGRATLGIA